MKFTTLHMNIWPSRDLIFVPQNEILISEVKLSKCFKNYIAGPGRNTNTKLTTLKINHEYQKWIFTTTKNAFLSSEFQLLWLGR